LLYFSCELHKHKIYKQKNLHLHNNVIKRIVHYNVYMLLYMMDYLTADDSLEIHMNTGHS